MTARPNPDAGKLEALAKAAGDPWVPENEYFRSSEAVMDDVWHDLVHPFVKDCDFTAVIDLAAGHGRNSRILSGLAEHLLVLDIQPGNVEICRERFAGLPHVECAVNNGYDLRPAKDAAFTLVYCFDAMVHFDKDVVRSYLMDTARVLRPGARGFFHHSNYTGGPTWSENPHSRSYLSAELFGGYAAEAGLSVVRQLVFDWGHHDRLDCLTLVEKP